MYTSKLLHLMMLISTASFAQNNSRYAQFISQFEKFQLPISTYQLLKPEKYLSINRIKIDKKLITEFVYNGDLSQIKYSYDKIDYDEGKVIGKETQEYAFSPVCNHITKELTLIIFFRTGVDEMKYFLAVFSNRNHKLMDLLMIGETHDDSEVNDLLASKIDEKLKLTTTHFFSNPEIKEKIYHKNDTAKSTKTLIQIDNYFISKTGKYLKRDGTVKKSTCSVNDFFIENPKCRKDNPLIE